jgi:YgiT-type zinc finger domain-containing protein
MQSCMQCGARRIARTKKDQVYTVGGSSFVVETPAFSCRRCRATFMMGPTLERAEREIACAIALRAPITGEGFRYMRRALAMRAADLAALLNVTAETVSRWENEQRTIDTNAWISVGSLLLEHSGRPPSTHARLTALRQDPKPLRNVRIDLGARAPARAASRAVKPTIAIRA